MKTHQIIRDFCEQIWSELDTPITLVLNEDGENIANGQFRELPPGAAIGDGSEVVIYNDDSDGYQILPKAYFDQYNTKIK